MIRHPAVRRGLQIGLTLLVVVVLAQTLDACPNCKDGLAQDPNRANVVRGYFWSILFMMSAPFLIFGGIGFYFYREMKRFQQQRQSEQELGMDGAGRKMAT